MLYWPVELVPLLSIWINWWSFSLALCPFISLPCKEIYFFSQKFDLIFEDGCHRRKAVVGRGKMKTSSTLVVSRAHRAEDRESSDKDTINCPVLKIEFGPPHADFGSVWSPQKAHKFRHCFVPYIASSSRHYGSLSSQS